MAIQSPPMTAEEFEAFSLLPANAGRRLELIGGEVVQLVSNQKSARIAMRLASKIGVNLEHNPIGYATSPEGGYRVGEDRYLPDIGYISKARQPAASDEAYNPLAPDLAVEVVSPSDETGDILAKVNTYLLAGVMVWVVYPAAKEIQIFAPGQPTKKLGIADTLDGGRSCRGLRWRWRNSSRGSELPPPKVVAFWEYKMDCACQVYSPRV